MRSKMIRSGVVAAMAVAVLVAAGCNGESQDWRAAQSADSVEAYDAFVAKHPSSTLATQAKARAKQITEDKDWERATIADNADSYREFVANHPDGKWSQEARIRIENLALPAAGAAVPGSASAVTGVAGAPLGAVPAAQPAAAAPAAKPQVAPKATPAPTPTPKPAPKATATPAAKTLPAAHAVSGGPRIQLGAFSSDAKARQEWSRITGKFKSELAGLTPQFVSARKNGSTIVRLQADTGSASRASSVCAALSSRGQGCFSVHN